MKIVLVLLAVIGSCLANMGNVPNSDSVYVDNTPLPADVNVVDVRQYFSDVCETRLNDHLKYEFMASQVYLSMATYLSRWDVSLLGFAKKLRGMSDEERDHGIKLTEYINKRGGKARLPLIVDMSEYRTQFETNDWGDIMNVMTTALKLERLVNHRLVDIVRECRSTQNYHMEDFIDAVYLTEQVDSIHELGRMITELKMIGYSHIDNFGLYQYDKSLR